MHAPGATNLTQELSAIRARLRETQAGLSQLVTAIQSGKSFRAVEERMESLEQDRTALAERINRLELERSSKEQETLSSDVIAEKSKLGRTWVGVIAIATVTSLPELVTGISSVTLADAPNIAVGNVLGACVLNLVLLAVLDFLYREMPIYQKASSGHILSAGFSIILIGLVVFSLITNDAATLLQTTASLRRLDHQMARVRHELASR